MRDKWHDRGSATGWYALGMDVIFGALRYIVVNRLEFIEDILNGLHKDWLEAPGERVWIVGVILFQIHIRL